MMVGERIGLRNLIVVNCKGKCKDRGGGLTLFWKEEETFDLISFSLRVLIKGNFFMDSR